MCTCTPWMLCVHTFATISPVNEFRCTEILSIYGNIIGICYENINCTTKLNGFVSIKLAVLYSDMAIYNPSEQWNYVLQCTSSKASYVVFKYTIVYHCILNKLTG